MFIDSFHFKNGYTEDCFPLYFSNSHLPVSKQAIFSPAGFQDRPGGDVLSQTCPSSHWVVRRLDNPPPILYIRSSPPTQNPACSMQLSWPPVFTGPLSELQSHIISIPQSSLLTKAQEQLGDRRGSALPCPQAPRGCRTLPTRPDSATPGAPVGRALRGCPGRAGPWKVLWMPHPRGAKPTAPASETMERHQLPVEGSWLGPNPYYRVKPSRGREEDAGRPHLRLRPVIGSLVSATESAILSQPHSGGSATETPTRDRRF